jgi:hypothetical protein
MNAQTRWQRATIYSVPAAVVGATVWLTVSYAQNSLLDVRGAVAFAAGFGVIMFVLQLWRG